MGLGGWGEGWGGWIKEKNKGQTNFVPFYITPDEMLNKNIVICSALPPC